MKSFIVTVALIVVAKGSLLDQFNFRLDHAGTAKLLSAGLASGKQRDSLNAVNLLASNLVPGLSSPYFPLESNATVRFTIGYNGQLITQVGHSQKTNTPAEGAASGSLRIKYQLDRDGSKVWYDLDVEVGSKLTLDQGVFNHRQNLSSTGSFSARIPQGRGGTFVEINAESVTTHNQEAKPGFNGTITLTVKATAHGTAKVNQKDHYSGTIYGDSQTTYRLPFGSKGVKGIVRKRGIEYIDYRVEM